jgi:hypothetical protein
MSAGIESGRRRTGPAAQPRRISLTVLRRHWQISKNLMMSTGTFYGQRAIMEAVFSRFNPGTAYDRKMIDNKSHRLHVIMMHCIDLPTLRR